jgi:hypothetical protein
LGASLTLFPIKQRNYQLMTLNGVEQRMGFASATHPLAVLFSAHSVLAAWGVRLHLLTFFLFWFLSPRFFCFGKNLLSGRRGNEKLSYFPLSISLYQ